MTDIAVYATPERCYQGHEIVRLEPDLHGWTYYCATCQAMVITWAEMQRSMAEPLEEGQIGRVCALPLREPLHIEWTDK